ncbi:MAG: flagellar basal body rod protein FlgC [Spirochaetaceae bacterium]|jgi:flagellar basal-body rod protein FlgC|nr:flagellar basal body rod protein FlgC [Spirochaetaceae bacterium]
MGLFSAINISASGMTAERLRSDVIADNLANINTTRTPEGGAYRRSRVVFQSMNQPVIWKTPFLPEGLDKGLGTGVQVAEIQKDYASELRLVYDPKHPDAITSGPNAGYVEYPNIDIVTEMVDMIAASRAYEANASMIESSKSMFLKALEIGK